MMSCFRFFLVFAVFSLASPVFAGQTGENEAPPARPETRPPVHSPSRIELLYKGYFLGLPMLSSTLSITTEPETYHITADFRSAGLAAWFKKANIHAESKGAWRDKTDPSATRQYLSPTGYRHMNLASRKNRHVGIVFTQNGAQPDVRPPFGSQGDPPPTPEQLRDVLDPLSAMLALTQGLAGDGATPCQGRLQVFDGKQRYDLGFTEKRWEKVRTQAYTGKALHCYVYYSPVAGFDPEDRADDDTYAKPINLWLAPPGEAGLYIPVKFQVRLKGWTGTVEAQKIKLITP